MDTKLKKTKKNFHLTDNERMLMEKYYHKEKYNIYKIAKLLKRDYKTISKELKNNFSKK